MAVVDKDTFWEVELGWVGGKLVSNISTEVFAGLAPGEDGLGLRVDFAVEHVRDCVSGFLARKTGPEDRGDIRILFESFDDDGTDGVQDNDGVGVDGGNIGDQSIATAPKCEVVSISFVAVNGDVALTGVRIGENNRDLGPSHCFCHGCVVPIVADIGILGSVMGSLSRQRCVGGDQIRKVGCSTAPAHCKSAVVTTAVAAGVDSIGIIMSVVSDDGHALGFAEWQGVFGVLQQYGRCSTNFSDQFSMVVLDVDVPVDLLEALVGFRETKAIGLQCP